MKNLNMKLIKQFYEQYYQKIKIKFLRIDLTKERQDAYLQNFIKRN